MKNINLLFILILITAFSAFAQTDLPPEQNDYYIYWGEQKVGYFTYTLKPLPGGWQMQGETFMSVLAGGRPGKIRFISNWHLDEKMFPKNYKMKIFSGEKLQQTIVVDIVDKQVKVIIDSTQRNIPISGDVFIIDTNTPEGWVLIAKSIDIQRDSLISLAGLMPQLAKVMPLTLNPGHIESDASGEMRKYFADFGGFETELFIKTRGKRVIYWNPKNASLIAKWTPELDREQFLKSDATVDVMAQIGNLSRIPANGDLNSVDDLEEIVLDLSVTLTQNIVPYCETRNQKWDGQITGRVITGRATVERKQFTDKGSVKLPSGPIAPPDSTSLQPTKTIQSDNEEIIAKSLGLINDCQDFWSAANKVCRYVFDSTNANTRTTSAKTTLISGSGDAISKARLCAALLRAGGIPTRIVGGYFLENNYWIRHHWIEVWLGDKPGWTPFDPTTGEIGFFSAGHIALWFEEGDLDINAKNEISITKWE